MDKDEVTLKYEPFKEIIVMERTRFNTPDDIARFTSVIAGGKLAGLYWVDGVVFLYFPLPASTAAVAKALIETGRVYWTFVGFSLMPKYAANHRNKRENDSARHRHIQRLRSQSSGAMAERTKITRTENSFISRKVTRLLEVLFY